MKTPLNSCKRTRKDKRNRGRATASLLILFVGFISITYLSCKRNSAHIPIMGSRTAVTHVINGKTQTDTLYHTIPAFSMRDQDSASISNETLKGKIYVADFFFTSCPTICPVMQRNMLKLADQFNDQPDIAFLSYTIDPEHDTSKRLKRYATALGALNKKWYFARGDRDSVYALAEKGYYTTANADATAPGGFVHSGGLILVDKEQRIRGIYDGTVDDDVLRLAQDLKVLQTDEDRKE